MKVLNLAACTLLLLCVSACADQVELFTGVKLDGKVVKEDADGITFLTNGAEIKLPLNKIYAVTVNGMRRVLGSSTPPAPVAEGPAAPVKDDKPVAPKTEKPPQNPAAKTPAPGSGNKRTQTEVEALINKEGSLPPPWWDTVPLNYPKTLDLSMPKPAGGWDSNKNVGQYFWSVINENPGKWKEGIKFANHLMGVNKDDPDKVKQAIQQMAHLYQDCLEDYARAAYLWRKRGDTDTENLAVCYWKLGNKDMAKKILQNYGADDTRHGSIIKLWSDMGELDTALKLAEAKASGGDEDIGYLMAGDACRMAGKYPQALGYYQKALAASKVGRDVKQSKARAQASIDAVKVFEMLDLKRIKDGTYNSESVGYSGQVKVAVTVKAARIEEVKITGHTEKQYYGSLNETPRQIIAKQGVKGVDAFSSATITSEAVINATAKALASGIK